VLEPKTTSRSYAAGIKGQIETEIKGQRAEQSRKETAKC
jgi:hypothetical protein